MELALDVPDVAAARAAVLRVAHRLPAEGLVRGTSGNASARCEAGIVITPSGIPFEDLEERDLVLLDASGRRLEGGRRPSSETPLHLHLYRHMPRVGGVVHTHSPFATTLSVLRRPVPAVHYLMVLLGDRIPVADYATYGTEELAANVLAALRGGHAALLANHGAVAVGAGVEEAHRRAALVEELAEIYHRACLLGEPVVLGAGDLAAVRAQLADYGQQPRRGRTED